MIPLPLRKQASRTVRFQALPRLFAFLLAAMPYLIACQSVAQDNSGNVPAKTTFHQLHTSQQAKTFAAIRDEVLRKPDSPDSLAARLWLFETARRYGWEPDAIEIAQLSISKEDAASADAQKLAGEVLAIGWAQRGNVESATFAWGQYLRSLRLRQPNEAAAVAQSVALAWQLRGQVDQAEAVYQQLSEAYFLNPELKEFAQLRRERLQLVGKPAPELSQPELSGESVSWQTLQGKVVLIDFWATNCRPCLEALPHLRRLYMEFMPLGVQFLGVSFDESPAEIEAFRQSQPLPWPIILDRMTAEERFSVKLIPCLMIVDQNGIIVATDVRPDDLRGAFDHVLRLSVKE